MRAARRAQLHLLQRVLHLGPDGIRALVALLLHVLLLLLLLLLLPPREGPGGGGPRIGAVGGVAAFRVAEEGALADERGAGGGRGGGGWEEGGVGGIAGRGADEEGGGREAVRRSLSYRSGRGHCASGSLYIYLHVWWWRYLAGVGLANDWWRGS